MTNKFEQLIEFVINDEEDKAKELFHDIVVEKSREIYENLMNDEQEDDAEEDDSEEDLDESAMMDDEELSDGIEAEEQGMMEEEDEDAEFDDEAEEDGEDLTHDMEKDHDEDGDIENRVVDLEDKLDELMAEFESLMSGEEGGIESDLGGEEGEELGGDALEMDDTEAFADESMMENVKLDAAPKPVTAEPAGTNTKSTVAFNSGAKGMQGAPVKMTGDIAQGRTAPKSGDLPEAGQFKNVPGKGVSNAVLAAAPKPVTAQASGVNTKTPFPKG